MSAAKFRTSAENTKRKGIRPRPYVCCEVSRAPATRKTARAFMRSEEWQMERKRNEQSRRKGLRRMPSVYPS